MVKVKQAANALMKLANILEEILMETENKMTEENKVKTKTATKAKTVAKPATKAKAKKLSANGKRAYRKFYYQKKVAEILDAIPADGMLTEKQKQQLAALRRESHKSYAFLGVPLNIWFHQL